MASNKFLNFVASFAPWVKKILGIKPTGMIGASLVESGAAESWINKQTGAHLTGAENEANAFNAAEAQKQRDWEEYMSNTSNQRAVADMVAAGLNPALMYGSQTGASTPSGSTASSVTPSTGGLSMSDLVQLLMLKPQMAAIKASSQRDRDMGEAALINARAAEKNAGTNERNAGTNETNAATNRMNAETEKQKVEIERWSAWSRISLNNAEISRLSEQTAFITLQREMLPRQVAVAEQNADSQAKQAIAALKSADAAVQNAATNDRLADYETSLKYTQELLTWYEAEGKKVIAQYLPERTRVEIDNMVKEGVVLEGRGRLVNRQGDYLTAQMVKTYVNIGTDISGAINQWLNPLSKGPGSSSSSPFDLSDAYQEVAYGYE